MTHWCTRGIHRRYEDLQHTLVANSEPHGWWCVDQETLCRREARAIRRHYTARKLGPPRQGCPGVPHSPLCLTIASTHTAQGQGANPIVSKPTRRISLIAKNLANSRKLIKKRRRPSRRGLKYFPFTLVRLTQARAQSTFSPDALSPRKESEHSKNTCTQHAPPNLSKLGAAKDVLGMRRAEI